MEGKNDELAIGVDLGGTNCRGVLFSTETWEKVPDSVIEVETRPQEGVTAVARKIRSLITELEKKAGQTKIKCAGIGMPGAVDHLTGITNGCKNIPGASGFKFSEYLSPYFRYLLFFWNDVSAHLFGEYKLGAGVKRKNLAAVALGTGIGGAIMRDGELISGHHNAAGEFGHIVIDFSEHAPKCSLGCSGCAEALAGKEAILSRWQRYESMYSEGQSTMAHFLKNSHPVREIFKQAERESRTFSALRDKCVSYRTVDETAMYLSRLIRQVVMAIDPEMVILSGKISSEQFFVDLIRQKTMLLLPDFQQDVKIVRAMYPDESGMRGAAALAYERAWDMS